MRNSSIANSRGVTATASPPRHTLRCPGSSDRSPAASTAGRSGAPRRISEHGRAFGGAAPDQRAQPGGPTRSRPDDPSIRLRGGGHPRPPAALVNDITALRVAVPSAYGPAAGSLSGLSRLTLALGILLAAASAGLVL